MQTSLFIAKMLGPFLLVAGAGILLSPKGFLAMFGEIVKSPALIYFAGIFTLATGLAIVLTHNVWTGGWPVIITVFGWIAVFAGVLRMTIPDRLSKFGARMLERKALIVGAAIAYVVLGGVLMAKGYGLI